ncbi:hypothetical protein IC582_026257 [Cucumis melo]|uniref:Uncharacterized protein LOC103502041 n=1 Tax=Cucumis melo TaxID=3656 RepID=A0A1S3CM40_CUCME|nr:uncharacterized protein LOC103502041 [Cucumis melo]
MLLHRTRSSNQYLNTSDEQEEAIEREEVESESELMEKAKQLLELTKEETDAVQKLPVHPKKPGQSCFYTFFALRGIQVDRVEPGLVVCTLKVPPRLTDRSGKLASGAIANLVDEIGCAVIYDEALPEPVSVDMSISYMSSADVDDELEIVSKLLGQKGRYYGTRVVIKNKRNGEIVAEGRHSLFSIRPSTVKSKL